MFPSQSGRKDAVRPQTSKDATSTEGHLMTLTTALAEYSRTVAPRTGRKIRHELNRWHKFGLPDAATVTTKHFEKFRKLTRDQFSATTIEDTVSDIRTLIKFVGRKPPDAGRRLRRRTTCKFVPEVAAVGRAYTNADLTCWPNCHNGRVPELKRISNGDFWRAWLCVGYFTALRLGDLCRLEWDNFRTDRIVATAKKTGRVHEFPLIEVVRLHLEPLRAADLSRPFPVPTWSAGRVRRELARCDASIGPQPLRRASVTSWACASAEAGRIVHGERLGVLAHYYDTRRLLADAEPRFEWPEQMLAGVGLSRTTRRRAELMAAMKSVPEDKVEDVLKITKALIR
jgi:integrase